jgi:hypothetical protein
VGEQILEPVDAEALHPVPHVVRVGRLGYATPSAEGRGEPVEDPAHPAHHLVHAAEEDGTAFLGKGWGVLGWQGELTACRMVLQIAGAPHPAQPLPRIAFVDARAGGQLTTGRGAMHRQSLKQPQAVTKARKGGGTRRGKASPQ